MKKKNIIFISSSVLALSMGLMVTAQNVGAETATPSVSERGSLPNTQNGEIVKTGVSGTCKWDYIKNDDNNYTLQFHAGNLAAGAIIPKDLDNLFTGTKISFDPGVVAPENCSFMFYRLQEEIQSIDFTNFDTSKVVNMSSMFDSSYYLTSLDLSSFDTSQVTDMSGMFCKCDKIQSLNLSSFNMSNTKYSGGMFAATFDLNHLVLGPKVNLNDSVSYEDLKVPTPGEIVPGTDKVVTSSNWIATSGYAQGTRYTGMALSGITNRDQVTVYDWDTTPVSTNNYESKAFTRTINVHQPDGSVISERQTATIKRLVTINPDGTRTYGAWSKAQWNQYRPQEIPGYEPDQEVIPARSIDSNSGDSTVDVYYDEVEQTVNISYVYGDTVVGTQKYTGYVGDVITPNYHAPRKYDIVSIPEESITIDGSGNQIVIVKVEPKITQTTRTRTKVRTINIHQPNGALRSYQQTAVVAQTIYTNMVTGEKTYSEWGTSKWEEFKLPKFEGYQANQIVPATIVNALTEDNLVDIFYRKI
ncbi:mucin-binding protein [Xylocopilactobacillus apicola]|uniref:Mub B2-like domain-containing protein n=1 Tax=Xylocopilactobacillus apicola TaxID=2932184 RepID=A0AAU9D742_9LACO|nr:BspA family leucine-rich repeat surface protein [Xylocopilactobacillus apicola]BDR59694.1 hypothetical protein XA3_21350 [Xylocopilactobacillus apicola]